MYALTATRLYPWTTAAQTSPHLSPRDRALVRAVVRASSMVLSARAMVLRGWGAETRARAVAVRVLGAREREAEVIAVISLGSRARVGVSPPSSH